MKPAAKIETVSAKTLKRDLRFRAVVLRGMSNDEVLSFLGEIDAPGLSKWIDEALQDAACQLGLSAPLDAWLAERNHVEAELMAERERLYAQQHGYSPSDSELLRWHREA
ncbi:MAG TPA: hypothetical protein VFQ61_38810 [Polyangiaceae bacterium]|nr:hypothetical protein [Polyangiaceae bacterium]